MQPRRDQMTRSDTVLALQSPLPEGERSGFHFFNRYVSFGPKGPTVLSHVLQGIVTVRLPRFFKVRRTGMKWTGQQQS